MKLFAGSAFFLLLAAPAMAGRLPPGFVYLRDVAPAIAQDMRYASYDNFTGRPLPGYDAPECVLRRDVAQALAKVQADLARQSLGLKVYDCYRPARAVRAFARWSQTPDPAPPTKRFFPTLEKRTLFAKGYIAAQSAHSTGNAVDLTLIAWPPAPAPPYDARASYGPCTGPADKRAPDNSLDMGTGFDCFDAKSSAFASNTSSEQNHHRVILLEAMRRHGLHNYVREWWHFSYGTRGPVYDVPIEPREAR
jgi:D-alanyl-D-alanine dipeptidase